MLPTPPSASAQMLPLPRLPSQPTQLPRHTRLPPIPSSLVMSYLTQSSLRLRCLCRSSMRPRAARAPPSCRRPHYHLCQHNQLCLTIRPLIYTHGCKLTRSSGYLAHRGQCGHLVSRATASESSVNALHCWRLILPTLATHSTTGRSWPLWSDTCPTRAQDFAPSCGARTRQPSRHTRMRSSGSPLSVLTQHFSGTQFSVWRALYFRPRLQSMSCRFAARLISP